MNISPFEIGMLVCFAAGWPISILKLYRTKKSDGKSLGFAIVLIIGYMCGILHKVFYNYDYVIYLYVFNVALVAVDIWLTLLYANRNRLQNADG